ncbi:hypothetical protein [Arenimonas composti]|uniref:Uncharacterized protein n=1 Tax=Arenimonas composti TR7-09 = DSM 18010 TaxID=1121013 RepID=A0A091B3K3_9GAMM|nr:hypothetical protein [Arenimonas composti]KFN46301.1 hypothetical protein P873_01980 [Arenimonas composti TR7-09 = DSM 18010]
MSRKPRRTPSRKPAPVAVPLNPRTLLLAGLGAAALGRSKAKATVQAIGDNAADLRGRADDIAREAGVRVARLQAQAQKRLAPVRAQVEAFAMLAGKEFETRFSPVLVKLGLAEAPRKPAPSRRAKATAPRTAGARKRRA